MGTNEAAILVFLSGDLFAFQNPGLYLKSSGSMLQPCGGLSGKPKIEVSSGLSVASGRKAVPLNALCCPFVP